MALDVIQQAVFDPDRSTVEPKVKEFGIKQKDLMPIEFNQYVNVEATLAKAAPRLKKPDKLTSADLLADLKER